MAGMLKTVVREAVDLAARRGVALSQLAKELEIRAATQGSSDFDLEPCRICGCTRARIKGMALWGMRKSAKLSLREVGELGGFKPSYLSRIERGHRPASQKIEALYRAAAAAAERKEGE